VVTSEAYEVRQKPGSAAGPAGGRSVSIRPG